MAHRVLLSRAQFGAGAIKRGPDEEQRVVAEPIAARGHAWRCPDPALELAANRATDVSIRFSQAERAHKPGGSEVVRYAIQFSDHTIIVETIALVTGEIGLRTVVEITGRHDPRSAFEGVDFQPRIIGEAGSTRGRGVGNGLLPGVRLERVAGLGRFRVCTVKITEPPAIEPERPEHGPDLVNLVLVAAGDEDCVHTGRLGPTARRARSGSDGTARRADNSRMAKHTANLLVDEAEALVRSGAIDLAVPKYHAAIKAAGGHPAAIKIRARLGLVLMRLGRNDEAAGELATVVAADGSPDNRYRLAQAHAFAGRDDEARALLEGILADEPDHAPAIARLAAIDHYTGRGGDAIALIDSAISRGLRGREIAHAFASFAIKHGRAAEAVDLIRPHSEDGAMPPDIRAEMLFSLGRLLDALDETEGAWAAFEEGNRLGKRPFDPDRHDRFVDSIIDRFSAAALRTVAGGGGEGARAILIVGMPRSGTTLMEQVLASHPAVASGGELRALFDAVSGFPGKKEEGVHPPFNRLRGASLLRARKAYLAALDAVSPSADRVTDKMPQNFVHLGYVPAILPGASVVHCRRDPRDTALSCYFRSFVVGNAYSCDLVWIARYMRAYRRLMTHWREVFPEACPETRFVELDYEALAAEPEPNARRLVEGVGLPWNDACLEPGGGGRMAPTLEPDQAGRGVYSSSVGRWRRYERQLTPFIEEIGDLPADETGSFFPAVDSRDEPGPRIAHD